MSVSIIWDWNGTLLDDREICLKGVNSLLMARGIPQLTMERYLQIFTFPVNEYYRRAGFDFAREPFEVPAEQFMKLYKKMLPTACLFGDVFATLFNFRQKGYKQFILSAMEQGILRQCVEKRNISHFFDGIFGIEDNFANSKLAAAKNMLRTSRLNPDRAIMIGDTLHDLEVGQAIGVKVLLVARGHQSPERLRVNGNLVFPDLVSLRSQV